MSSNIKSIVNEDVNNKVVILRADLNIPIVNGVVQDHTRLNRLIPTINYLLENQSKLVICSCLLYTSPSPRDVEESRMPSSA